MRWLLHGHFTPAVAEALVRHGHTAETVGEVLADRAGVDDVLALVRRSQRDLVTNDKDLVQHLLDRPTTLGRSVVYLNLPGGDVEQDDAVDRLLARYKSPKPDMLYTVTETRVKVRQLATTLSRPAEDD